MPSLTIENYVKAIYMICNRHDSQLASTGSVAEALDVAPGTVTSMLKTLGESGLAEYTPYEGVRLTNAGRSLALRVVRRHRLIELFLVQTLGLTWDEVHSEAENMEHAVSDNLVDRMDEYLGYPKSDPHGDPIPSSDGTIDTSAGMKLTLLEEGQSFQILRVLDQSPDFLRYLSDQGLELGRQGEIVSRQFHAGIITIKIDAELTTLAREGADKLMVEQL